MAETLNIEVSGITLITGDVKAMIEEFKKNTACETIIYPESKLFTGKELVDYAKQIVDKNKTDETRFLIITNNFFFIRGIECDTYVKDIRDRLNVYYLQEDGNHMEVNNIVKNAHGMHELYKKLIEPLDELESMVQEKNERNKK